MRKLKSLYIILIISILCCLVPASGDAASMPWIFLLLEDNRQPIADAGEDQMVKTGEAAYLDGSNSSDPDGDTLTYSWSMVSPEGSSAELSYSSTNGSAQFTPDMDGTYTLTLIVNDGKLNSDQDVAVITSVSNFPPVADAGVDQAVETGSPVSLDGSDSYDPEDNTLTYFWSFAEKPVESSAFIIYNANYPTAQFIPDVDGDYTLSLVVNDGTSSSEPDTVVITSETTE